MPRFWAEKRHCRLHFLRNRTVGVLVIPVPLLTEGVGADFNNHNDKTAVTEKLFKQITLIYVFMIDVCENQSNGFSDLQCSPVSMPFFLTSYLSGKVLLQ